MLRKATLTGYELTVGIIYKVHSAELLRAHSGERCVVNRPPRTPHATLCSSDCALSAHTLYKAGEVLTALTHQNKHSEQLLIEQSVSFVRCELTSNGPTTEKSIRTFVLVGQECASSPKSPTGLLRREGIIPPLPQPYGQYHNTIATSNCQVGFNKFFNIL